MRPTTTNSSSVVRSARSLMRNDWYGRVRKKSKLRRRHQGGERGRIRLAADVAMATVTTTKIEGVVGAALSCERGPG